MLVPVYLSHQGRPELAVLVNALLDTQPDTTFIHDDICNELGLEGSATKLLLSTMVLIQNIKGLKYHRIVHRIYM